jgi:hypothetical protein
MLVRKDKLLDQVMPYDPSFPCASVTCHIRIVGHLVVFKGGRIRMQLVRVVTST